MVKERKYGWEVAVWNGVNKKKTPFDRHKQNKNRSGDERQGYNRNHIIMSRVSDKAAEKKKKALKSVKNVPSFEAH